MSIVGTDKTASISVKPAQDVGLKTKTTTDNEDKKAESANAVEKGKDANLDIVEVESRQIALATQRKGEKETQNNNEKMREQIESAVKVINDYMKSLQRDLEFNVDEDAGRTIIKVIDKSTNEIVRVLPPEEAKNLSKSLQNVNADLGAIIDLTT